MPEKTDKTNDPWQELDVPQKGELTAKEINDTYWNFVKSPTRPSVWDNDDIRRLLKERSGTNELVLRGPAQVVKGSEPVVVVTHDLEGALEVLFDFDFTSTHHQQCFVQVQKSDSDKVVEAKLKVMFEIRAKNPQSYHYL